MLANRSHPVPTLTPVLVYPDVRAAVAFLEAALGFEERVRIGDDHRAQLARGADAALVVADLGPSRAAPAPGAPDSHSLKLRVADAEEAYARACAHGAEPVTPPTDYPYGERTAAVRDPGGHLWELSQTLRDVEPEEWGGVTVR